MKKLLWFSLFASIIISAAVAARSFLPDSKPQELLAVGIVFNDKNRNEKKDPGEEGIPGVRVSNGLQIVKTSTDGKWRLPYSEETIFFVIKPRGWMTPINHHNLPRFYYNHKPKGSPDVKYEGVKPTGPLPASIEFPLHRQTEPKKFRALFFGDTQPRDQREVNYIAHDVVEDLIGFDAAFGVTLGDVVFDDLSIMEPLNAVIALIGIPWYNVLGNHDINYDARDDEHSDETWERVYGPPYYSFDYGPTHFIVLDDVNWSGRSETDRGRYTGGLGKKQMAWVKNDLALIPKDQLVVLMMHIPLVDVEDRHELYRLIEQRPYALSVSAHTHYQEHKFITKEDGWQGPKPHHHVINVTVCGSWWQGAPDELGIPHTTMRDGAPNGYSIFTFDGHSYSIEYRAARRPSDYQMNIYAPEAVSPAEAHRTLITANVFGGSEKSIVELSLGDNAWQKMNKVSKVDPRYEESYKRDATLKTPYRPLPGPEKSTHIWEGTLPRNPKPGTYRLQVRTTDMFGHKYTGSRVIRIE